MAILPSERKAAQAAKQKLADRKDTRKYKRREATKKPTTNIQQSMTTSLDDLMSACASQSGWKPRSQRKAGSRPGSEPKRQRQGVGRQMRLNSDDMKLPKRFVAENAESIFNVTILNQAREQFRGEILLAKRNPETTPQKMAELEVGFQTVGEQIRLQTGDDSPTKTPRLTPHAGRPVTVRAGWAAVDTSPPSLLTPASKRLRFATPAASSQDVQENSLSPKPKCGSRLQSLNSNSTQDPEPTLQDLDIQNSNPASDFVPLPKLHRRGSGTQALEDLEVQRGNPISATIALVEEDLPPDFEPLASGKEPPARCLEETS